ncbi:LptA/OstA family protein [Roseococcus microcysteis]|uniref:LptA/OstA family protein n=1 Tax=Roseococcus microcysteis TaxID=2771361 RepID=UPI00168B9C1C|nr:LptA/OstA family protein [Roseococcus microcysteis]
MIRTLALLAPLLLGGAALAQTIDLSQGGPVDITANDGIEWRQAEQVVVARGGARAERAGTAVDAARLLARYRPQPGATPTPANGPRSEALGGSNEIWRLEAEGNVRISTATDVATGDRAVYDMDQSVLVLSGRNISLTTPQQAITARDSLEYWTQRRMAVARGNALVVTEDGRRITADVLVAYLLEDANNPQAAAARAAPRPGTQGAASPPPGQGRLDRVELFGNVEIRSAEEVVRGDRGVYSAETGQARLLGNVRITRGQNQINGQEALVNLNTGVSRLVGQGGQRVQGVVAPGARESTLPGQGTRP